MRKRINAQEQNMQEVTSRQIMPRPPKPLRAVEPEVRGPGIPDDWPFPQNLVAIGNKRGLSQADIATLSGKDQGTVSKWLSYKSAPESPTLLKLERALGIPIGTLLSSVTDRIGANQADSMMTTDQLGLARAAEEELKHASKISPSPKGERPGK